MQTLDDVARLAAELAALADAWPARAPRELAEEFLSELSERMRLPPHRLASRGCG